MENLILLIDENREMIKQWLIEASVMVGLLTVLYFILQRNLFGPLGRIIKKRETRMENAVSGAENALAETQSKLQSREDTLRKAHKDAASYLDMGHEDSSRDAESVVLKAREQSEAELEKALAELQIQTEKVRTVLERESHELARLAASRLLGDAGASS